jgi:hypothetical protein
MPNPVTPGFADRMFHIAIDYLGMPYEDKGPDSRLDCSQLLINVFRRMGFMIPDMRAADLRDQFFTLDLAPPIGPVVGAMFRRESGKVVHVGLLNGSCDTVIHASGAATRVVVQALDNVKHSEVMYLDAAALLGYLGNIQVVSPKQSGSQ